MALCKSIRQSDGVVTTYHRILYYQIATNRQNSIVVQSYTDNDVRNDEKWFVISQLYNKTITYEADYDPSMIIEKAYTYLKTLPEFDGADDI